MPLVSFKVLYIKYGHSKKIYLKVYKPKEQGSNFCRQNHPPKTKPILVKIISIIVAIISIIVATRILIILG